MYVHSDSRLIKSGTVGILLVNQLGGFDRSFEPLPKIQFMAVVEKQGDK